LLRSLPVLACDKPAKEALRPEQAHRERSAIVMVAGRALNELAESAARHTAPAERVPGLTSRRAGRIVTGFLDTAAVL
jgi:hypothetical protein